MAWSDIFLPSTAQSYDEAQAHIAAQQQALADAVAAREAAGTLTTQDAAAMYSTALAQTPEDQNAAAAQGLAEGAMQGLNNVLNAPGQVVGAVGSGLSQTLWGIVKNIPWWIYVAALFALFVWMGGLSLLRGRLARA